MPRKAFITDLKTAQDTQIPGITKIKRGENDEDIELCFVPQNGPPIEIGLLATPESARRHLRSQRQLPVFYGSLDLLNLLKMPQILEDNLVLYSNSCDVSAYPNESLFMIFTRSADVPPRAAAALEDIAGFSAGMRIPDLVTTISQMLHSVLATGAREAPILLDSDVEMLDGSDFEEESEDEVDYGGFSDDEDIGSKAFTSASYRVDPKNVVKLNRRIRHDLRAAKFAGFSIGILTGMKAESVSSLVSLSIRVAKLGLSEEALQAWDLEPNYYIFLLIRYSNGYRTFEAIINEPAKSSDVEFRIGVSNRYKPTVPEAIAAFTDITKDSHKTSSHYVDGAIAHDEDSATDAGFGNLFISSSLNDYINAQFISLLKIRNMIGVGWDGAKRYLSYKQGKIAPDNPEFDGEYYQETSSKESTLPEVVTADHLTDIQAGETSFPLLAAQFAMRYLTRCTEFCLVCHDKIDHEFGALKPYVCDKPLCLYQYMSLGFGPSVEHEILTQPYVVDLLVSFCYVSAFNRKLREYPTGMSLAVPPVSNYVTRDYTNGYSYRLPASTPVAPATSSTDGTPTSISFNVTLDLNKQEIYIQDLEDLENKPCPVRNGDWIVITTAGRPADHYRIEDISFFPRVKISSLAVTRGSGIQDGMPTAPQSVPETPATTPPPQIPILGKMVIYNCNFDEMSEADKAETIVMLLETLPAINDLRSHLIQQSRHAEPNLRAWKERISPAALGILRWIIASNRSCIVQVDKCPGQSEADIIASKIRLNQRVSNIGESFVQFRFAQGSPDKEQKFLNALKAQQSNFDAKYPTIFAWHGSPLPNWHSIIRSGLDFKEIAHGRAFGNGVYHSQDQNVSVGYAMVNQGIWHGSALKISSAMSLNEIVNCTSQFTSCNPHLVVQHIDWIQCRFLLVQVQNNESRLNVGGTPSHESNPAEEVEQDPKHMARSTLNKPIGVPLCAVSVSRAFRVNAKAAENAKSTDAGPKKKRKGMSSSSRTSPVGLASMANMAASEDEDIADITFLFSEDEADDSRTKGKSKENHNSNSTLKSSSKPSLERLTNFRPGALDQSQLPMLEAPSYATPAGTKSLNRALQEVLEVQKKTPSHELGWYINPDLINNVYQWIVELHSFDATLPLAKDMKAAGVTSIVLEIRFGKDFPFSPPFVRVIRPRFLPFSMGGGGHVTAGGAICMELLTNSGWSSASSIESVLLQVRLAIMSTDPKPARLEGRGARQDYGTAEAIDAYVRACRMHGWAVPAGFVEGFSRTGGPSGY